MEPSGGSACNFGRAANSFLERDGVNERKVGRGLNWTQPRPLLLALRKDPAMWSYRLSWSYANAGCWLDIVYRTAAPCWAELSTCCRLHPVVPTVNLFPMHGRDRHRIRLLRKYKAPRVRVGEIATCLYRACDVVVTSWTDAPIPWPRCHARSKWGGSGLHVDESLATAIRTESAESLKYWFGVGAAAVWAWRRAFGVKQWGTIGSRRLLDITSAKANKAARAKVYTDPERRRKRRIAPKLDLAKSLRAYRDKQRAERTWTADEVALLGTMKDTQLATKLHRSRDEVRRERVRRGIPGNRKPLSPEAALPPEQRHQLRRERIAAAKCGKKRPRHVIEAMRKAVKASCIQWRYGRGCPRLTVLAAQDRRRLADCGLSTRTTWFVVCQ